MMSSRNDTQTDLTGSKANCLPFQNVVSGGIWFKDNPLDYPYPLTLAQIILVVLTSQVLYCFLRPLGQSKFACNLLSGFILGPSVLGRNKAFREKILFGQDVPLLDTLAALGTMYSLFLISVKVDAATVRRAAKDAWKISLVGSLLPFVVTLCFVYTIAHRIPGLNGGTIFLLYATFSLSFTYFPVVAEELDELNLMSSELGQLAMSSSAISDAMQWVFTAVHLLASQTNITIGIKTSISLLAMILFTVSVIRPVITSISKNTPEGKEVKEGYVIAIVVGFLVMGFISDVIGTKPTVGPIILGLVIPCGSPLGAAIIHKTEHLVSEFLLPLFFFSIGSKIDVFSVNNWTTFTKLQLIIVVSFVSKIVGVTGMAFWCKFRFKTSLLLGMIMNMKGLIELINYSRWKTLKAIDEQCFTQIVLSSLGMTMIISPLVSSYAPQRASKTLIPRVRSIQAMASNSETFHILCCFHNEESVPNIITLLEASNPTEASPICAYIVHAVELLGHAAPLVLPCNSEKQRNKLKRDYTTTYQIMRAFDNYSETSSGPVIIEAYTMMAPYKLMHETLFNLADDKFVPLIIIPFHENRRNIVDPSMNATIRQFNANVQSYSACTVGILVDRSLPSRLSLSHYLCNIALFFIGGPDDREALAYAARMSNNPNVGMTVIRITRPNKLKEGNAEERVEAKLDDSCVDEFRRRNIGNKRLIWREIEVYDGVQLVDAVMSSQGNFDLVMVGRRHSDMTLRDEHMAEFVENAELGVIGDFVASSDFCGGTANVLVIQESRDLGHGFFSNESPRKSVSGLSFMATKRLLP